MKAESGISIKRFHTYRETLMLFLSSLFSSIRCQKFFKDLEKYCMFIGYPRSGHSLVGSLLDAHPNMVIAHELDALHFIKAGFSRRQLCWLILKNSLTFAQEGRKWTGYSYMVHNQWHGRFKRILVIGDKKGAVSTHRFGGDPKLLSRLLKRIRKPIKFIHIVRNPYDNISTIMTRRDISLEESIEYYFSLCSINTNLKQQIPTEDLFEMRYEDLIADPEQVLKKLCQFLEVEYTRDYLRDCASIIFKSPHRSREKAPWAPELIEKTKTNMKSFSFLQGYSFKD